MKYYCNMFVNIYTISGIEKKQLVKSHYTIK